MGFLVAFSRKMYLTSYINSLEVKVRDMTEQRLDLTETITQLTTQISDIGDNDSAAVKKLKARQAELENLDKQLEMRMQKYQAQLQAAQTEQQSADQALQKSIERSFSYNFG